MIPASMEIFIAPRSGIKDVLYSSDCLSKISQHGILTIRIRLSFMDFATLIAKDTSEPVAKKTSSGFSQSITE